MFSSVQLVAQSCPTLSDPMDCSTPGFPVHHQLPEFTQIHVHRVGDTIQPFHPLSSPFSPTLNLSQHQGLFQWASSSHQVAKVLEFQLQHQSFQWIFRTDFLKDWLIWSPCSPRDSQEFSPTPQFKSYATLEARNKLLYVSYVLYLDLSIIAIILTNTACFYYFFHKSSSAQKEILSKSLKWEVKNKLLV